MVWATAKTVLPSSCFAALRRQACDASPGFGSSRGAMGLALVGWLRRERAASRWLPKGMFPLERDRRTGRTPLRWRRKTRWPRALQLLDRRCRAMVLACTDVRADNLLHTRLASEGFADDYDLMSWPGGALALLTLDRPALLKAIAVECGLHRSSELLLVVHHDCHRLGGSSSFPGREMEPHASTRLSQVPPRRHGNIFPTVLSARIGLSITPPRDRQPRSQAGW